MDNNNQNNGQYNQPQNGYNPNYNNQQYPGSNYNYAQPNPQQGYQQQGYQQQAYNPNNGYGQPFGNNREAIINSFTDPAARREIAIHILLLLVTCGIYLLVWIYKTTAYLNKCPNENHCDPTSKLLLCMFIPFYMFYWVYKQGQKIDTMYSIKFNSNDSSATMYLILMFILPIVPYCLMQDKINKLCAGPQNNPYGYGNPTM